MSWSGNDIRQWISLDLDYSEKVFMPCKGSVNLALTANAEMNDIDNVLDVCSGSGFIGFYLKSQHPKADITCSDYIPECYELMQSNKTKLDLDVNVRLADMFEPFIVLNPTPKFDLITCNPPFMKVDDLNAEQLAQYYTYTTEVDFNDQYYCFKKIAAEAPMILRPDGKILMSVADYNNPNNPIKSILEESFNIETLPNAIDGEGSMTILKLTLKDIH